MNTPFKYLTFDYEKNDQLIEVKHHLLKPKIKSVNMTLFLGVTEANSRTCSPHAVKLLFILDLLQIQGKCL